LSCAGPPHEEFLDDPLRIAEGYRHFFPLVVPRGRRMRWGRRSCSSWRPSGSLKQPGRRSLKSRRKRAPPRRT